MEFDQDVNAFSRMCWSRNLSQARQFVEDGRLNAQNINKFNSDGETPLVSVSSFLGAAAFVDLVFEVHGMDPNAPDVRKYTAIMNASEAGCEQAVNAILDNCRRLQLYLQLNELVNGQNALTLAHTGVSPSHKAIKDTLLRIEDIDLSPRGPITNLIAWGSFAARRTELQESGLATFFVPMLRPELPIVGNYVKPKAEQSAFSNRSKISKLCI